MSANAGLDGVVVADTVLSLVDGEAGRLVIRGFALEQLAGACSYERALQVLLAGFVSDEVLAVLPARLGAARAEVFHSAQTLCDDAALRALSPVEALRALLARLPDGEDDATALRLIAAPAVFTAAIARARRREAPIAPDAALGHAADLLHMLRGRDAHASEAAALETYLVTVLDHGLNASTFAARVVASTRAGLASAVIAGLSALKGPLHGGAPGPVLHMLDAIGRPECAAAWIDEELARGARLMGFGHRIYRVRDPRADALRGALQSLDSPGSDGNADGMRARLKLAEAVERSALQALHRLKPQRSLQTNVEFYTAVLLEALGFARESFTCVFAAGRVGGWIAHAREQLRTGRLIRPQSHYVGPPSAPGPGATIVGH
ncbi:MAG TPA: citrate synthase/methylcitrate synthase [Steroidobacteraceae bacterium]|jgi:citrate synthase|nr:citrate synthase/methylcitrate synthase [Steroidobacteraceae bacterium]